MSILDDIGSVFSAPVDAVKDVVSWLQWVSWLFNPLNWLRMVEFVLGCVMFGYGLRLAMRGQGGREVGKDVGKGVKSGVEKFVRTVATVVPK